ncbi:hypothetical protein BKE38_03155 [Pseudoroseomonas deserti]|uniref:Uncharacterized protein n=1 Tax=Teichococcus deserti TaxID=1817963 RepID=A0A1V2H922_9PROT|nr:hypothetical protein [Pseudoroseomonas deserti]ONG58264.1 hypothetical protein BKE38_03155 [Pseudoroseomonas deserti]
MQEALDGTQQWDAELPRLTSDDAASKMALSTRHDSSAAMQRFSAKKDALLAAMERRQRCQTPAERMRRLAVFRR